MMTRTTDREAQRRYKPSPKGREKYRRYNASPKGHERKRCYNTSPKGLAAQRDRSATEKCRPGIAPIGRPTQSALSGTGMRTPGASAIFETRITRATT
jgi:hypothetical protein